MIRLTNEELLQFLANNFRITGHFGDKKVDYKPSSKDVGELKTKILYALTLE